MRKLILASVCFLSWSPMTSFALFDDKEARQWIQDLQQKTDAQNQATQASLEAIKKSIAALEAKINTQGIDLLNQIETLNQELSAVKGKLEEMQHELELSQKRQKDLYADTDSRLRKLESASTSAAGTAINNEAANNANPSITNTNNTDAAIKEVSADETEIKAFENAQSLLKQGKNKEAFEAFDKFIQNYSNSKQLANAKYNLGYAQFSLKNFKAAIATQQKLIAQFPDSSKVPDAKFNIANCQIQLSDVEGAKKTLRDLIDQHPASDVIPNAKRRLTILQSLKK